MNEKKQLVDIQRRATFALWHTLRAWWKPVNDIVKGILRKLMNEKKQLLQLGLTSSGERRLLCNPPRIERIERIELTEGLVKTCEWYSQRNLTQTHEWKKASPWRSAASDDCFGGIVKSFWKLVIRSKKSYANSSMKKIGPESLN
jgi:hypothetical protein